MHQIRTNRLCRAKFAGTRHPDITMESHRAKVAKDSFDGVSRNRLSIGV